MKPLTLERIADGWSVRLRFGNGQRGRFVLPLASKAEAERRANALVELAAGLAKAGLHVEAPVILRKGATQTTTAGFAEVERFARELCGAAKAVEKAGLAALTFQQLGELWTSGELHRRHPDHVKLKGTAKSDAQRLGRLYKTIGSIPLRAFTLPDAEAAMRALPADIEPATRRHYGQLMAKVLKLAVYPCKVIGQTPLPAGFLPKAGAKKAKANLYPVEDETLLGCTKVPLSFRLLYGFLAREGMRYGEAMRLTWADLDLGRGAVTLDINKSDDPRAWALSPGVAATLAASRPDDSGDDALVFARAMSDRAAELFREHLALAGLDRPELFRRSASRVPIRVHDLRGTFVTLALADGKSESWVADRTGHRSSQMINAYRRAARTAAELGLGSLKPLNEALNVGHDMGHAETEASEIINDILARPVGFEPTTSGLEIHCSIQLSYGRRAHLRLEPTAI
jgi:integrase